MDEGFLWNGTLRIKQGKIPIRDYKSYDPGRYYWCWAWMQVFGFGIHGLRHSAAIFQFLGLWAGLVAVHSVTSNLWLLFLAGIVCALWMLPRHKLFENAIPLVAICTAVFVVQNPSAVNFLIAGVVTGLSAFLGRNHGVYNFAAFSSLLLLLFFKDVVEDPVPLFFYWSIGIAIGYSPMLAMWAFIPRMFDRYWHDKVMVFARRKGIDLPVSIPWPWQDKYLNLGLLARARILVLGMCFVTLPVFYVVVLLWIFITPMALSSSLLVASCLIGIFYTHRFWSRSDLSHLCQAMQPFLLALFALIFSQQQILISIFLLLAMIAMGYAITRAISSSIARFENPERFVEFNLNGERLWIPNEESIWLNKLNLLVKEKIANDERLFIAPISPTLYPLLGKQTPVHSDFLLFPESEQAQKEIIEDLRENAVNWALIQDHALDENDKLRFKNTHPILWNYITANFVGIPDTDLGNDWQLLQRVDRLSKQ